MNCPTCGATVLDEASFCERCGQQVRVPRFNSTQLTSYQFGPQPTKDNKAMWIIVIVVVIVVAAPVVLAAALYFMVVGFNPEGDSTPILAILERTSIPNGHKFAMSSPTQTVTWTDFTVILQTGANSATWDNAVRSSLTGSGGMTEELGARVLGVSGSFFVNATDLGGNGAINNGDYITITGPFASGTSYTVILIFEPTQGKMADISWTA